MSEIKKDGAETAPDATSVCRYATESSLLPMAATEGEGHIIRYANPAFCRLVGRNEKEILGRPFSQSLPEGELEGGASLLDHVYRAGEPAVVRDHVLAHAYGKPAHLSLAAWVLREDERRPKGLMVQVTDVTSAALLHQSNDRANEEIREVNQALLIAGIREHEMAEGKRNVEQQLFQAQKMDSIGQLAGGIAHDFNNLLTVILGFAELAEQTIESDNEAQPYLLNIQKAAERAAALTSQLLSFARKQIIAPKVANINALVLDVDRMLRRLLREQLEIELALHPDAGQVNIDPGLFGQVLLNLVVNARDSMAAGGRVTIETSNAAVSEDFARHHIGIMSGKYVLLAVRDTGCGMDAYTKSHLFEPFFTTKPQGKGTGLGLATCHGIVKQSGGYIDVESEPGKGTSIRIYLPRVEEATSMMEPAGESSLPRGTEVIFLAEDEPLVREIVVHTLRRQGYAVFPAENGEEALVLMQQYAGDIDLLVTDMVMPQMGGRELVDRLRPTRPRMKVLYISGYTTDAVLRQGIADLGLAYLQKPFTPATLAQKVRAVLDSAAPEETKP